MTLKTLHEMLDGMSVELAEKVHLLFMANYIDYSDLDKMKTDITCFLGVVIEATKKFVEDKKYKRV